MISGLNFAQVSSYTLKDDKQNPTVWKLGVIPSFIFSRICDEASKNGTETVYKMVQLSLRGWENLDIPYETKKEKFFGYEFEVVPMDVLNRLPMAVIAELSGAAMKLNGISEEERKN